MEEKFDAKVITTIAGLYKEMDELINSLGLDIVREHSPELEQRANSLKSYINDYAQRYCKGLAYAEKMDVSEIEETVKEK